MTLLHGAILLQGGALAVLVGVDGSLAGRAARVLVVAVTTWVVSRLSARRHPAAVASAYVLWGVVGTVAGIGLGVARVLHGALDATTVAAGACLVLGLALLGAGAVTALRAARGWRKLLGVPLALALVLFALYPLPSALYATNAPRPPLGASTPGDRGLDYLDATFRTQDGVTLAGWYLPSRTGAAVVLAHGASSTRSAVLDQAAVLARAGYGVLLFDARGHGASGGRAMELGWFGDLDVAAAVRYLVDRPDVDPSRIGAVGLSMGGEEVIGAAAGNARISAVVAEGATGRTRADKAWLPRHWRGWIQRGIDVVMYGATDVLTDAAPPMTLRDAVARTAPRPVLLIAGGAVTADVEEDAGRWIASGAPDTVEVWVVPGSGHTEGLATQPAAWEARVTQFLQRALG